MDADIIFMGLHYRLRSADWRLQYLYPFIFGTGKKPIRET